MAGWISLSVITSVLLLVFELSNEYPVYKLKLAILLLHLSCLLVHLKLGLLLSQYVLVRHFCCMHPAYLDYIIGDKSKWKSDFSFIDS